MVSHTYAIIRKRVIAFCIMKTIHIMALMLPPLLLGFASSCISREYPVTSSYTETAYRTESVTEIYTENETTVDTVTNSYELQPYSTWYSQNIAFNGQTNFWYLAYEIPQSPPYDNLRLKVSIWKQLQYESASIRILDMTKGGQLTTPDPAIYGDTGLGRVNWTWITASSSGTPVTASSSSGGTTDTTSESTSAESVTFNTGGASITWLDTANIQINQARFLGGRTNLWSRSENPQVLELDAGKAQKIGIIVCGPQSQWNARITMEGTFTRNNVSYKTAVKERQAVKQVPYDVQKQKTTYQARQVPFWEIFSR